jgi:hypothetical protein
MKRFTILFFVLLFVSIGARPVPLLVPDVEQTKLVATTEGLQLLRQFGSDRPVVIISFVGRARSGKSFGLNNLLGVDHASGFVVGHTFRQQTSGALIWSQPMNKPEVTTDPAILLIDTEGLATGAQTFDKALLATLSVISTRLVYHMTGYVYSDDVIRLHGLTMLVEEYVRRGIVDKVLIPRLTWIVNKNDLQRSYPQQSDYAVLFDAPLAEQDNPTDNSQIAAFNATIRVVRTRFERQIVHLVPTAAPTGITDCSDLVGLSLYVLSPGYQQAMEQLKREILAETPRKVPGSDRWLTGPDVASLIETVLPAANEGMECVGDRMVEAIIQRRLQDAKTAHALRVDSLRLPTEQHILDVAMTELENDCVANYLADASIGMADLLQRHVRELEDNFAAERMRVYLRNVDASEELCDDLARQAALRFSRDNLTNGNEKSLDLMAFDVAVVRARASYDEAAIGPRREYHRARLAELAREARETVIVETAPGRKRLWLGGAVLVAIACRTVLLYARMFAWWVPMRVIAAALEGTSNLAAVVTVVTLLSILGCDALIRFETMVAFLTWSCEVIVQRGWTILVIALTALVLFVPLVRLVRPVAKK